MRMSSLPKRSTVASTIALTSSSWRTSTRTASADPPALSTSAATVWMLPGSLSLPDSDLPVITTAAPSRASRSDIARPMPRLDPVTTATRPSSGRWSLIGAHHMRRGDGRSTTAVRREACVAKGVLTWVGLLLGVGGIIAFIYGLTVLISNGSCGCDQNGFCSGPPCPPADDLGFLGLFAGIWVAIGGFILMGFARGHARALQWRQQYAGGANSFANMSRAYAPGGGVPGLTLGAMSSGSIAPGTAPMTGLPTNP